MVKLFKNIPSTRMDFIISTVEKVIIHSYLTLCGLESKSSLGETICFNDLFVSKFVKMKLELSICYIPSTCQLFFYYALF